MAAIAGLPRLRARVGAACRIRVPSKPESHDGVKEVPLGILRSAEPFAFPSLNGWNRLLASRENLVTRGARLGIVPCVPSSQLEDAALQPRGRLSPTEAPFVERSSTLGGGEPFARGRARSCARMLPRDGGHYPAPFIIIDAGTGPRYLGMNPRTGFAVIGLLAGVPEARNLLCSSGH